MSTEKLSIEYVDQIICQIASYLKLTNFTYDMQDFESIGQNYFGIIMPVTVSYSTDDDTSYCYHVVLKLAPTDERYRVSGAVTEMFYREIFVYTNLLKKFEEMQAATTVPKFYIPTLYFSRDEYCKEVLAMTDMTEDGFKPYTHRRFLDLDHITVALESLARFHAMSFALKEQDCLLYDEISNICVPLTECSNKRYIDIMIDRLTKASTKFENTVYQPLLQKLKENCGKLFNNVVDMAKHTCICHGDIWKENILFMYEDWKPREACVIDYQTTRVSTPAFDTLYLIISSTDTELRHKNYNNLLDIYYKSFQETLKAFGLESDIIYSREIFDQDLKLVAPACLITVNTALWLSYGLQEEGHVRSKLVWNTPEEKNTAVENYKTTVKGIIDDLYEYSYLPGEML